LGAQDNQADLLEDQFMDLTTPKVLSEVKNTNVKRKNEEKKSGNSKKCTYK
jgi:hypothetical protein